VLGAIAELSDFGLNAGLLRFLPYYLSTEQPDKVKQLLKTIWQWRIGLVGALTVGGVLGAYPLARYVFDQTAIYPYLMYAASGVGGVILLGLVAVYLQASQRYVYSAALQSLKGLVRLVIAVILWLAGVHNLYAYLSVYVLVPWVLFLINFSVFPKGFRRQIVEPTVKKSIQSQLGKYSFWLTVSSLIAVVGSRIDQAMISHYLGLAEVALFTVAWQFIQLLPVFYSSINSVLMPKISALHTKAEIVSFFKKMLKWGSLGTVMAALFIYPSQYLIVLFFGQSYAPAMPLYVILAYSLMGNIFALPFSLIISVFNRTHLVAYSGFVQFAIMIIGNLMFIPRYGIMGAAYTFALSMGVLVLWNIVCALYLLKKHDLVIE
jgi:O-antigen/teichoic acid export membrane protein